MKLRSILVACAVLFAAAIGPARAAMPPSLEYFVGNWSCVTTFGGAPGFANTAANTVWGSWVKEELAFPAAMGEPATTATAYLGYDAKSHRWIYNEIDFPGTYFVSESSSADARDSKWTSAYPATDDVTLLHVDSNAEYTLDSKFTTNGKAMSFHQVCTRK